MKIEATLYKTDGSFEPLILDKKTSLKTLHALIGGLIEIIHIVPLLKMDDENFIGNDLILNEVGLLLDLPINPWSSYVGMDSIWEAHEFRGDMILVKGKLP
ncbi:Uncharacterised protein [uncultured archaeon]|nr:Uncharacterised protein [uncultured archaeon]